MIVQKFHLFPHAALKALAAIFIIASTSPIQSMDMFDADSSDSDSDTNGMNIFRQVPKRPSYDLPMESLIQNLGGLSIETRDCSLYNRALEVNIQKSQELYNVLTDMLKLATNATSFAFGDIERAFFNGEFSIYLRQLETILSRKESTLLPENDAKRFVLPGGHIRFIPPINPLFQSLVGANLFTQRNTFIAKNVLEYLIPQLDGHFRSLSDERWKLHNVMGSYLNY